MRWTAEQDMVLFQHGHEGAEACRRIIHRRFGVLRSVSAVERHAYRVGASLFEFAECPGCGARVRNLKGDGLCPACHERSLAEAQAEYNRRLKEEIRRNESGEEYIEARRAYDAARKEKSRLVRGAGLPAGRNGDSVDLSKSLSNRRSGREEFFQGKDAGNGGPGR